jgi:hypothetical protein
MHGFVKRLDLCNTLFAGPFANAVNRCRRPPEIGILFKFFDIFNSNGLQSPGGARSRGGSGGFKLSSPERAKSSHPSPSTHHRWR